MTYDEFKAGLFAREHYVPNSSILFIPSNKNKGGDDTTFTDIVALIIDAERVIKQIKNKNMVEAFKLMAKGFLAWETAEEMCLSERTIRRYINKIKKDLEEGVLF